MKNDEVSASFDRLIEEIVGLSVNEIKRQSADDFHQYMEDKAGVVMRLGRQDPEFMYRGSVLLSMDCIDYDIDKSFDDYFVGK